MRMAPLALLALAACRGFSPVPPALAERIDERAERGASAGVAKGMVEIESRDLGGSFRALYAWRDARARLQLWPDLGDKLLDCAADESAWFARRAGEGPSGRRSWSERARDPARFFAMTILEHATPLRAARIRGARRHGEGTWELNVAPASRSGTLRVVVDADGRWLERRFRFRGATWRERPDGVTARGFRMRLVESTVEPGAPPPEAFAPLEP
jgi:hypothetical protein